MGSAIADVKSLQVAWTPIYLWEVTTKDEVTHYWSTHAVTFDGNAYSAIVLDHSSPSVDAGLWGFEAVTQVSLTLNNADASLNATIAPSNWQGALLVGRFVFYDPATATCTTDSKCFGNFRCDLPVNTWPGVEFVAYNMLNFARKVIPVSVITKKDRYPFPSTVAERLAAGTDPTSEFYAIGYDPDNSKGEYKNPNLITNGAIGTGTGWSTYGGDVAFADGKANFTTPDGDSIAQDAGIVPGTTYRVEFTISNLVAGAGALFSYQISSGAGWVSLSSMLTNGLYSRTFTAHADATGVISIYAEGQLSIDDVSLGEEPGPYYIQSDYNGTRDTDGTDGTVCLETIGLSARFGGFGKIPPSIMYTPKKGEHEEFKGSDNQAKIGQAVPLIYGTCRIQPIVLDSGGPSSWNGSRLSHLLLCDGVNFAPNVSDYGIDSVLDVILPGVKDGKDYRGLIPPTSTGDTGVFGSWNYTTGQLTTLYRNIVPATDLETFDPPDRDLYSGLAYLTVGYPKELAMQSSDIGPKTEAIVKGLQVETWDDDNLSTWQWSDNPVWIYIDILKRLGYPTTQIDKDAAYDAAYYCDTGGEGAGVLFGCNLALMSQVRASDVLRGLRANARIYCTYGSDGKLQVKIRKSFAEEGSAFAITTANIVRDNSGKLQFKKWHKSYLETANVFSCNFQDPDADYIAASLTKIASDNVDAIGERVSADSILSILGCSSYDHAERALNTAKSEYVDCNEYYTVRTTLALIENQVGQVGTITEARHGLSSQQCRIVTMAPQRDGTIELTLQKHLDASMNNTTLTSPLARIINDGSFSPRSVGNLALSELFYVDGINASVYHRHITASFAIPPTAYEAGFSTPTKVSNLVVSTTGGSILGATYTIGQDFYFEVCATKSGVEGLPCTGPSQWVHIPVTTDTNKFSFDLELPAEADGYTLRIGAWDDGADYHVVPVPGRCFKHSTVVTASKSLNVEVTDITGLDETDLSPDPAFDHVRVLYYYGNASVNAQYLRDAGRTYGSDKTSFTFCPEPPPSDESKITVLVVSSNAAESDFYPWYYAPIEVINITALETATGNPSGCSGLSILLTSDDATIPTTDMAFQFTRDTAGWQTIFAVEVALRSFTAWAAGVARTAGNIICNIAGTMTFICTVGGANSGSTEPTWNTGMGSETADGGTVKWRRCIPPAAHGPYALQRATHAADVLASGSAIDVVAGSITITLNIGSPPADHTFDDKVLLLFTSDLVTAKWASAHVYSEDDLIVDTNNNIQKCTTGGTSGAYEPTWDADEGDTTADNTAEFTNMGSADKALDGNIIETQLGNAVTIFSDHRFIRTATVNWAVVEPWWTANEWERTFKVPEDIKGGNMAATLWRTATVPKYSGKVVAADVYTRNVFGVSQ